MCLRWINFVEVKESTESIWSRHQADKLSDIKQVEILHELYPEFFQSRFKDAEFEPESESLILEQRLG